MPELALCRRMIVARSRSSALLSPNGGFLDSETGRQERHSVIIHTVTIVFCGFNLFQFEAATRHEAVEAGPINRISEAVLT